MSVKNEAVAAGGRRASAPGPPARYRLAGRAALLGTGGLLLAAALGLSLQLFRAAPVPPPGGPPEDPRLAYAGPFRNVAPDVRYVPDSRCADCHRDKARTFAEHPMGRSLLPVARVAAPPEDSTHNNPFDARGARFAVVREGDRVLHRRSRLDPEGRPVATQEWEVHYVIGSGARGYSYLSDRDGYLIQTPVSWYSQKDMWGLSPGFGPALLPGRAVQPNCLFCHANRANHVDGSANRYARPAFDGQAIGCQRCHGPGELHVASRQRHEPVPEKADYTIVNPRHLERPLREAVCEQCHLTGEARVPRRGRELYDFRPGLPLQLFWSVFVAAGGARQGRKAVSHVEQMYQSRCFQGGAGPGQLGCISCHDPHERVPPAQRDSHYRGRCLQCHQQQGCSLPQADRVRQAEGDSCIACHMPRYGASNIPHTAATDHRILRRAEQETDSARPASRGAPVAEDGFPMISFYRGRHGAEGEDERDRAVVLVKLALAGEALAPHVLQRTLAALEAALRRDPNDLAAGEARGYALGIQGQRTESLAAFEAILVRAPDRELALVGAAAMAEASGQTEAALGYLRRAAAANPWAPEYRRGLVLLLVKKEAWDEARPQCEAWVRLDPLNAEARGTRVACLLAAGDMEEARAEFARVEALAPDNLTELRARYSKKLR